MKKIPSVNDIILTIYLLLMLLYVYASATGISVRLVLAFSLITLMYFAVKARYITIERGEGLWLLASTVMIIWTRRIESDVIYYNVTFLFTLFILIVMQSNTLNICLDSVIKIFRNMALATVLLVMLELVFKTKMTGILSIFLPTNALNDELLYISAGTGLRGLATSTNAVSLAAFIILTYSLYNFDANRNFNRYLSLVLALIALVVCGERSNFIFVPLTLCFVYLTHNNNTKGLKYIKIVFIILLLLGVFLIIKPQLEQIPALKRTFRTLDMLQKGEEIAGERSILYKRAFEMWQEKPIFGHGWFEFYYQNTGILKAGSNSHAHNLLFESLSELGIIGTILLFMPITHSIVLNISLLKRYEYIAANHKFKKILEFTLAMQVFFILDSMLHLTFFSPRVILYLLTLFILFNIKRKSENLDEI